MRKTTRIILAMLIICISVFGLCSCGSSKKSLIGTWSTKISDGDIASYTFADDKTGRLKIEYIKLLSDNQIQEIDFEWEVHSEYTYKDDTTERKFKPSDRYEGVLVLSYEVGEGIFYFRFDEDKERLYLVSPDDNKSEISFNRE